MILKNKTYFELENIFQEASDLNNILKISQWDFATKLKKGSAISRQKEMATLAATIHKIKSNSNIENLIERSLQEQEFLNKWQKSNLLLIKKQFDGSKIIPVKMIQDYNEESSRCEFLWRDCRKNNDFKSLAPHFDKLFSLARKIVTIKSDHFGIPKYDILIDQFDPERKFGDLKPIFQQIKRKLPDLINKIIEKQSAEKFIPLKEKIDKGTQRKIEIRLMEIMGFNLLKGRLDESSHPFCGGSEDDTRITTTYHEQDFLNSSYSVIHELGHGLYQQNLPVKYRGQPVGEFKGFSFHESQSRIMEVQIGTSPAFLEFYAKLIRDEFGVKGEEYNAENIFKLKTRVKPGLIRIDADEVTYPMHVILRSEIEEKIINTEIKAIDIPDIWNKKMQEYLGIMPDCYSNGCLQDMHWPSGLFGYFPCYIVGSLIASMLMKKIRYENCSVNDQIEAGDFKKINSYLNTNLREFGSIYSSSDLLLKSTGEKSLNTDTFFEHIKEKYINY
jgi:carboxypeptidase Taq